MSEGKHSGWCCFSRYLFDFLQLAVVVFGLCYCASVK